MIFIHNNPPSPTPLQESHTPFASLKPMNHSHRMNKKLPALKPKHNSNHNSAQYNKRCNRFTTKNAQHLTEQGLSKAKISK